LRTDSSILTSAVSLVLALSSCRRLDVPLDSRGYTPADTAKAVLTAVQSNDMRVVQSYMTEGSLLTLLLYERTNVTEAIRREYGYSSYKVEETLVCKSGFFAVVVRGEGLYTNEHKATLIGFKRFNNRWYIHRNIRWLKETDSLPSEVLEYMREAEPGISVNE